MTEIAPGQKWKKTPTRVKLDQEGPYLHAPSGAYYARYRLNGKQRPVLLPIHSRKPDLINIASPSPAARR